MLKICFIMSVIMDAWAPLTAFTFHGGSTWTLQTQCKNKKRVVQQLFFEVAASHTTRVLHVSCMFWGCCSDTLIVKFDEAVHEVVDGRYSTLAFEVSDIDGYKITDNGAFYNMSSNCFDFFIRVISYLSFIGEPGFYFISDGGYPKVKYLICPFKWPEVRTDRQKWSSHLETIIKDIERNFGSIKQRCVCLVNPITLQESHCLEQMFNGCCILHNIIIDYNGADNWRKRVVGGLLLPDEVIDDVPII
jgi:hypothetical protein